MGIKDTGERLAVVETEVKTTNEKIGQLEQLIHSLHGKIDAFTKLLTENYVPVSTFDQYKLTQKERERNKWLERIVWTLVEGILVGLLAFYLRGQGI